MSANPTLYLIDGSAYFYRAFHAVRDLRSSSGQPTNAVFGFANMLLKLIEQRAPTHIGICFDTKAPTFRHDMYVDYKANRPPMPEDLVSQLPFIHDMVDGFNIAACEKDGYEADDIIGTLASDAAAAGFSVVIVSGDKDFKQLVTPQISMYDPMKDKVIDVDAVKHEFGLGPEKLIDVMALMGDKSDNVPGVPGVGPKTAAKLIAQFGSLDAVYAQIDQIKGKKLVDNLKANHDNALLSRRLVSIDLQAPVVFTPQAFERKSPQRAKLYGLFKQLEFQRLQQMFVDDTPQARPVKTYVCVDTPDALEKLAARLSDAGAFALDTETTDTDPMRAELVGLSFAVAAHEGWYVPCGHQTTQASAQLPLETVLNRLRPLLEDAHLKKVGQNIKYDWIVLARHGVNLAGVCFDTMIASYLLNPTLRAHSLDQIALDFFNHTTTSFKQVIAKAVKPANGPINFSHVPIAAAADYAAEDADITWQAYQLFAPMLAKRKLDTLMNTVEMPLAPVLMQMELTGIGVDRDRLRELSNAFAAQMAGLTEQIHELAGEAFNINSSQQLGTILFEKLKLPAQKKTRKKTGYSTDVSVLTTLADRHELPAAVLRFRTLSKLKSTYTDALIDLIHPETGRIHTSFNQTVTVTGRLSSSDPNLQNIPIRTEEGRQIREAFVAAPGHQLLSADYSQIELRLLAHCADDPIMIDAFARDEDIHTRTAGEVFQTLPGMITDDLRRQAKAINFGIVYGISAYGLSKQLGISRKMAQTYIDHYLGRYQGVRTYMRQAVVDARKNRQTSTLLGRIRQLPEIDSKNRAVREFAERTAINTPIQGTAADLIKLAMVAMHRRLARQRLQSRMLLSVHDEILFEVPDAELDTMRALVKSVMEGVWELKVPLKVSINWGKSWAEAH